MWHSGGGFRFDPWATSADSGLRLTTRARWLQRLKRLRELPGPGDSTRWTTIRALVMGLFVGIWPLVQLSTADPQDDAPTTDPAPSRHDEDVSNPLAESPYRYTFANGESVELIGIAPHPLKDARWWRPDGDVMEKPPCDPNPSVLGGQKGQRGLQFCVRWHNVPEDADRNSRLRNMQLSVNAGTMNPSVQARSASEWVAGLLML